MHKDALMWAQKARNNWVLFGDKILDTFKLWLDKEELGAGLFILEMKMELFWRIQWKWKTDWLTILRLLLRKQIKLMLVLS